MRKPMSTATFTRTDWKTSDRCSSGRLKALMLVSSRFICSVTLMSSHSVSTSVRIPSRAPSESTEPSRWQAPDLGHPDQSGGRVMPEPKDKAELKERPKKPPGYRKFERLLRQVVKSPPLKR